MSFFPFTPLPPAGAAGGSLAGTFPNPSLSPTAAIGLQVATPVAGFTLTAGTPSILSWTAPNDGKLHRVLPFGDVNVSVATTGGLIQFHLTDPGGTAGTLQMDAGTHAAPGFFVSASRSFLIQAGTTITISQDSAVSAGNAVFYGEIWAT